MANMEEEMARFEEEIFKPGEQPGNNFGPGPPPMPPPMFLPHSLNANPPNNTNINTNKRKFDPETPHEGNENTVFLQQNNYNETGNSGIRQMGQERGNVGQEGGPMGPGNGPMGLGSETMGPGSGPMGPENGSTGPVGGPMGPSSGPARPGSGPMGPGSGSMGPGSGSMGPGSGSMGPGPGNQMFPSRFPGPGPAPPWADFNVGPNFGGPNGPPLNNNSMIGPMPPPMPDFFPPPMLPNFGEMMPPINPQTVYSSAPVLKKKKVVPEKKPKPVIVEAPKEPDPEEELRRKKEELDRKIEEKLAAHPKPTNAVPNNYPTSSSQYMPVPLYGGPQATNTNAKKKKVIRTAAGQKWEDPTLLEWDPNDYRIFCGDLGNEVTDDSLARVFNKYSSFQKARVIREKNSKKSKGYGFVSFKDPTDFIRAMREMQGKYVGNRPIKLRKSNWKERNIDTVRKKTKEKKKLGYKV